MSDEGRWPRRNGSRRRPDKTRNGIRVLGDVSAPKEERLCSRCGNEPALPTLRIGEACRRAGIAVLAAEARARGTALG